MWDDAVIPAIRECGCKKLILNLYSRNLKTTDRVFQIKLMTMTFLIAGKGTIVLKKMNNSQQFFLSWFAIINDGLDTETIRGV